MKLFAVLVLAAVASTAIADPLGDFLVESGAWDAAPWSTEYNGTYIDDDVTVWANFTDPSNINQDSTTVASASSVNQDPSTVAAASSVAQDSTTVASATSVNQDASTINSASSAAQGTSTAASASSTSPSTPGLDKSIYRLQYVDDNNFNGPLDMVCRAVESNSFGNRQFQELQNVRWRTGDSCNNQRDVELTLHVEVIAETSAPSTSTNPPTTTTTTTTTTTVAPEHIEHAQSEVKLDADGVNNLIGLVGDGDLNSDDLNESVLS